MQAREGGRRLAKARKFKRWAYVAQLEIPDHVPIVYLGPDDGQSQYWARVKTRTYQVWDDATGNIVASYASREAALAFLRGMLDANGPSGVTELAVIEYPSDGSDPVTVLEGAEFLEQTRVQA